MASHSLLSAFGLERFVLTAGLVTAGFALRWLFRRREWSVRAHLSRRKLWMNKTLSLLVGAITVIAVASVWFHDGAHFATFSGILAGGVAFAMQRALLSMAAFFVIVLGRTYDLGDRIEMGGVRGDVLDIGLLKTTIMEMGVPARIDPDPKHWVGARQYSGRVVTLANAMIFDKPVFNYSRLFGFLWEELRIPLRYEVDLQRAEQIAVEAARHCTQEIAQRAEEQLEAIRSRYLVGRADLEPQAYVRLTDNWIELSVRFICDTEGVRELKDRMSREILGRFQAHDITIASSTFELVGAPPLRFASTDAESSAGSKAAPSDSPAAH